MLNMQKMMKEMQKMQGKLLKAQEELESTRYDSEAGGGMVKLAVDGKGKLLEIKIDARAVDPDDVEALEDLVLAAFNSAIEKKDDAAKNAMGSLTGGMKIPGIG